MKDDKILETYHIYRRSHEYDKLLQNNRFDITWLIEKLGLSDSLKLEASVTDYASRNDEINFKAGFIYAWKLFHQCSYELTMINAEGDEWKESILELFETYRTTEYYEQDGIEFDWLADKLSNEDIDDLQAKFYEMLYEYEKESFLNCSKYLWRLFSDLSK